MALGLLLYVRGGFLGALTVVLCVEMAALAAGFWSAPRDNAPPWGGVRRAWFLLLMTYVAGAVVATSWEALEGLSASWVSRGIGLAFLGALPMYGTGLVLGVADPGESGHRGAAAALGAAAGFAVIGLARSSLQLAPFSYVAAVVVVAAGALVQSRVLGARELEWREWAERGTSRDDHRPDPAAPGLAPGLPPGQPQ
jgi:hypothetical protein